MQVGSLPNKRFTADDYWFVGWGQRAGDGSACSLPRSFSGDWLTGARHAGGWLRPIPRIAFYLNDRLFGLASPAGYHLTNILLHASCAVMVGWLARALLEGPLCARREWWRCEGPGPVCAGLFFAAYPPAAGAASWISGRTDLLAGFFLLLALLITVTARPRALLIAGVGLSTALACLSKETGFLAPVYTLALMLHVRRAGEKGGGQRVVLAFLVSLAVAIALFLYRRAILGTFAGYPDQFDQVTPGKLARWLRGYLVVAGQVNAGGLYSKLSALVLVIAGTTLMIKSIRTGGTAISRAVFLLPTAAIFWLIPALPIINMNIDPVENGRYLYLSGLGVALVIACISELTVHGRDARTTLPRVAVYTSMLVLLATFMLGFRDTEARWAEASRRCDNLVKQLLTAAARNPGRPVVIASENMDFAAYEQSALHAWRGAKLLPWDQAKWALYRQSGGRYSADWGLQPRHAETGARLLLIGGRESDTVTAWEASPAERIAVAIAEDGAFQIEPRESLYYALVVLTRDAGAPHPPAMQCAGRRMAALPAMRDPRSASYLYPLGLFHAEDEPWTLQPLDSSTGMEPDRMELLLFPIHPIEAPVTP